jgi:prolyl oligopeptidase
VKRNLILAASVLPSVLVLGPSVRAGDPRPPETRTTETSDTLHGVTIADPYRWLEDQAAPETRAWIDAQNASTHAVIDALPGRERIERRLTELI